MAITRGTTPTSTLRFPESVDFGTVVKFEAWISGRQSGQLIKIDDLNINKFPDINTVQFMLTQEQTLAFIDNELLDIQMRLLLQGGATGATRKITLTAGEFIGNGVLE